MMPAAAFLSFATVESGRHQEYNAWHQLDHRPENLALEGVMAGERWVRTPECAAAYPVADPILAGTHYVNSYWFRAPVAEAFASWQSLAERSFQEGRRPDVRLATRPMMGTFTPTTACVSPGALVSPPAMLHRPVRGVILSIHRLTQPRDPHTEHWLGTRERAMRDRVALPGVAGAWSLSSLSTTIDPGWQPTAGSMTFDPSPQAAGVHRAELTFLDEDPFAVAEHLPGLERSRTPRRSHNCRGDLPQPAAPDHPLAVGLVRPSGPARPLRVLSCPPLLLPGQHDSALVAKKAPSRPRATQRKSRQSIQVHHSPKHRVSPVTPGELTTPRSAGRNQGTPIECRVAVSSAKRHHQQQRPTRLGAEGETLYQCILHRVPSSGDRRRATLRPG